MSKAIGGISLGIANNNRDAAMLLMNKAADQFKGLEDALRSIGADLALGNAGVHSVINVQHMAMMTSTRSVELMSHALLLLVPEVDNEQ